MPEYYTIEMFSEDVGKTLLMRYGNGQTSELKIVSVTDVGSSPRQLQFSVVFQAPVTAPIEQGIYRIEHDKLGELELFLVPISRDKDGVQYEASFNRLIE